MPLSGKPLLCVFFLSSILFCCNFTIGVSNSRIMFFSLSRFYVGYKINVCNICEYLIDWIQTDLKLLKIINDYYNHIKK